MAAHSIIQFGKENGISRSTVYNLIAEGRIVARKLGDRTLIFDDDNRGFREALPIVMPKATPVQ